MQNGGVSCEPGNIDKHAHVWTGRVTPADGCGCTASGGGCTDAQVIKLARKISAIEAQIEQLEQRNANLEESLQSLNSNLPSLLNYFNQCASSLPSV